MTPDEIKNAAVRFRPMPDGLNAAEVLYFVTMRSLSADYQQKRISAETARQEGLKARRAFDRNNFGCKLSQHSADLWKGIEATGTRFAKEHTLEAADEFYRTVYGLGRNWRIIREETPNGTTDTVG